MSEPFTAEIRIFPYNFAPSNWAYCDGTLLQIAQNTALFSLIGTMYGGDGQTTTGLPNLQGRAPLHTGSGPGLTPRSQGSPGGAEAVTLTTAQMPAHTHALGASDDDADARDPDGAQLGYTPSQETYATPGATVGMGSTSAVGGGQAHENRQPYLALSFCIALLGTYPSQS